MLVILPVLLGLVDIRLLLGFRSSTKKQNEVLTIFRIVKTVALFEIYATLPDAAPYRFVIAEVA
ncbi:hypothetical protein Poly41_69730 [Novipirellula artificiosorum]|uniref:Uncharacterized protein n=1 Tax=Novipirellula artificiosorum TaxID=2528016 RepID=A0A5C6CX30_9BACT|nr:hypothetical protein Poly41_69730 [Novipirellula artificiosorum]